MADTLVSKLAARFLAVKEQAQNGRLELTVEDQKELRSLADQVPKAELDELIETTFPDRTTRVYLSGSNQDAAEFFKSVFLGKPTQKKRPTLA